MDKKKKRSINKNKKIAFMYIDLLLCEIEEWDIDDEEYQHLLGELHKYVLRMVTIHGSDYERNLLSKLDEIFSTVIN